jgi:light-harvesting complex I chlorophyll a/b binding protein 1
MRRSSFALHSLIIVFLLCWSGAAFRPPPLSEELGCSPTLSILLNAGDGKKAIFFDPLGIATDTNFGRLREAELKHGRIAMLVAVETIAIPILRRLNWPYLLPPNGGFMSGAKSLQTADYLKVLITCGILETLVFVQKDPKDMPGDYGIGYFGVRDKGMNENELLIELENGRLAMLAILIQLGAEVLTGGLPWEEQWVLLFKRWALDL